MMLVKISEMAELFGVHVSLIYGWADKLPEPEGSPKRYDLARVMDAVREHGLTVRDLGLFDQFPVDPVTGKCRRVRCWVRGSTIRFADAPSDFEVKTELTPDERVDAVALVAAQPWASTDHVKDFVELVKSLSVDVENGYTKLLRHNFVLKTCGELVANSRGGRSALGALLVARKLDPTPPPTMDAARERLIELVGGPESQVGAIIRQSI